MAGQVMSLANDDALLQDDPKSGKAPPKKKAKGKKAKKGKRSGKFPKPPNATMDFRGNTGASPIRQAMGC